MILSRKIADVIVRKGVTTDDVVEALRSYNLLALLPSIKKAVEQMNRDERSQESIAIESPFPLDAKAIARIKRIAGNDLALHSIIINKDLLAGFKARFKGKLYDGSAERIVRQISNSPNSPNS